MDYIYLVIGFLFLIKGADYFVDGSSNVAKLFQVPPVIIGLTIVACGTSLPELSVSLTAAMEGANELAIGNVVGSNVFNSLIAIGMCAFIAPIKVSKELMRKEFPFSILVTIVLLVGIGGARIMDAFTMPGEYVLSRQWGFILLAFFVYFISSSIISALKSRKETTTQEECDSNTISLPMSALLILGGGIGIGLGGNLVIGAASAIGEIFGLSHSFIGLTIVALGTSLPELVTSLVAAKKGENDMAMGNVIGSNIFNVLLIVGVSASISPIRLTQVAVIDVTIAVVVGIVVYLMALSAREVSKKEGLVLIFLYVIFFTYIFMR